MGSPETWGPPQTNTRKGGVLFKFPLLWLVIAGNAKKVTKQCVKRPGTVSEIPPLRLFASVGVNVSTGKA